MNASETADFGDQYNKELPELIDDSCFAKYCNDKVGRHGLLLKSEEHESSLAYACCYSCTTRIRKFITWTHSGLWRTPSISHSSLMVRAVNLLRVAVQTLSVWVNQEKHPLLLRAFGLEVNSDPQVAKLDLGWVENDGWVGHQVVVLSTKKKRYSLFVGEFSVHVIV